MNSATFVTIGARFDDVRATNVQTSDRNDNKIFMSYATKVL